MLIFCTAYLLTGLIFTIVNYKILNAKDCEYKNFKDYIMQETAYNGMFWTYILLWWVVILMWLVIMVNWIFRKFFGINEPRPKWNSWL